MLSSGLVNASDTFSHAATDCVTVSLCHSGRLKMRSLSSHQTAVRSSASRLFHSIEECSFKEKINSFSTPSSCGIIVGAIIFQFFLRATNTPAHTAFVYKLKETFIIYIFGPLIFTQSKSTFILIKMAKACSLAYNTRNNQKPPHLTYKWIYVL